MDLGQHTKALKILAVIPFLVALLTIIETVLPYKVIDSKVVSKKSNYRVKTNSTTYTVNFEGINDQFTESIFNTLSKGDEVELKATYFSKQIRKITRRANNVEHENSTSEPFAQYIFALIFLSAGLVWFKSGLLKNGIAMYLAFAILLGSIQLVRIIIKL